MQDTPHTTALADTLNHGCRCQTLDAEQLRRELGRDAGLRNVASTLAQTHPHLFSNTAVFASQATVQAVQDAVAAIERTLSLSAWAQQVLPGASAIAQADHGPLGVFMGYDFHITPQGPQLIEINANAGGAMLNAVLLRAQAGVGLDKDAARKAREALKARIEPLCAIKPEQLQESDLRDLGADRLFSLDELGAGECMA